MPNISMISDPHIWLSISNAREIVQLTQDALAEIDPANKARYHSNAAQLFTRLDALDSELRDALSGVRKRSVHRVSRCLSIFRTAVCAAHSRVSHHQSGAPAWSQAHT